ncbi:MAG: hypothetical protein C3F15_02620 [Holophagae bacterium]|nr:MAG: hypothetical protein C3F15_02620 [Holophagae bacterium]
MRADDRRICSVCGRALGPDDGLPSDLVRQSIQERVRRDHPDWQPGGMICADDIHRYRIELVEEMLTDERGELSVLDAQVVTALKEQELLAADVNKEFEERLSPGQWVADRVARFGGSWAFLLSFGAVLLVWVFVNSTALLARQFDPYPFILLNLILSCVAAMQAPIIMMSQNRQEAKDRLRSEHDYRVNLKAELEVRLLNARFDHLLSRQWQRLLEIQKIQLDLMEEIATHRREVERTGA